MADPARERPTFEELYASIAALPAGSTGEILEPGVLRVMSRPGRGHRKAHAAIVDALRGHDVDRGGRGWWIEVEPEVRIGELLMVPDIAGWRVERVAEMPADNPIAIAPDWVCEVLSPSTERDDRRLKLPSYASAHVAHVWLVEPVHRLAEVFESRDGRPTLIQSAVDEDVVVLAPFDGPIALAPLWMTTPPTG